MGSTVWSPSGGECAVSGHNITCAVFAMCLLCVVL